jgi:hypothetical protein
MRCLGCQYDLSNLPEHRCPECGRPFDPTLPETFKADTKPICRESNPWIGVLLVIGCCMLAMIGYYLYLAVFTYGRLASEY